MNLYYVRFQRDSGVTQTDGNGPFDFLINARARRNQLFNSDSTVKRCWIDTVRAGQIVKPKFKTTVLKREWDA